MNSILRIVAPVTAGLLVSGLANASEIPVSSDISGVVTWTKDNTYNLQDQIYVLPGATLIIEAGTVIASDTGLGGSLAVTNGGQIFANGTREDPIIFTSKADVATWAPDASHPTGKDPKTGVWREAVNEWGNLTIMGDGFISENAVPTNVPTPNAANYAGMEGLTEAFPGDPNVRYGGGNDEDNSGSLQYVSLRYGGKVIGLGNELNGLSLGGVGRGTDIDNLEIMNNVDDGVEIWGGTVNLKNFSIWNIGDDSFDVDQGWRGKAQFGLIVQGYSTDNSQGSGVGDNVFETDGAEACNWQPVTTAAIYNCTVIGQPLDGDKGTAWRDNARVQYRNMVFMDLGDKLVDNEGGGDGECGYGGGIPAGSEASTFDELWTTPYSSYFAPNWDAGLGIAQADFYAAQQDGNMIEIKDSVFFRLQGGLGEAPVDLTVGYDNVNVASTLDADSPIKGLTRGALVVKGGKNMLPVVKLDPRAQNEAATSVGTAPNDGFFTQAQYRGAFSADHNWLWGWTASDAFGFTTLAGSQVVRNSGIAPNPTAYTLGTNAPTVGEVWDPRVDHTSFVPGAFLDFVVIAPAGAASDIPVPGFGAFLCGFTPFLTLTNVVPGSAFAIPIPDNVNNVGAALCTQGGSFELSGAITLANAIDIVIGNE